MLRECGATVKTTTILVADQHPIFRMGLRATLEAVTGLRVLPDLASPADLGRRIDSVRPDVVILDAGIALQIDVLPLLLAATRREERPRFILLLDDPAATVTTDDLFWDALAPRRASVEEIVAIVRELAARPPRNLVGRPTRHGAGTGSPWADATSQSRRMRTWQPSPN